MTNFRLSVLETDGSGGERIVVAKDYFTDLTTFERQAHRIDFPAGTRGRIVRLEKLGPNRRGVYPFSIAEVEVLAGSPPRRPWIEHSTAALMQGKATRAYLRVPLGVPGPTAEDLRLRMRFDDSFVAYLNGQEVARQDLPPTAAGVAPPARRTENEVAQPKEFSLTALLGSLQGAAKGMLAIEGRNSAVNDSGFLLAPTLLARHVSDGDPGYFTTPTPGELNATVAVTGFLEELRCSPERGFYEKPFVATLTGLAPASGGYQIRYTVDGSEPTGTNGVVYDGSIPIQTTIVLRAAAFCPGYARGPIVTQTFIFLDDVPDQKGHGLPPKWDRYPGAYTFRREGISTAGGKEKVVAGLRSLPTLSIVMKPEDLFGPRGIYTKSKARGKDWERPCSMEWFQPTSSPTVQIDCGVRIFGFSSRSHSGFAKHSFRLLFKRKYGATKLRFPLFPDWPIQAFDDIVLRAQGRADPRGPRGEFSFCQHLRDAFARYSARDMGKLTTAATHVHLYLNGLYWGLYNPIERPDAEFMANHLGGEREDYDALNARVGLIEVVDGSQAAWSEVMELSRGNVASKALYAELERRVNLPDLINYILLNFFLGSEDWPGSGMGRTGNNMRVAGSPKNGVPFRAFVWDMENSVRHLRRDSLRIHTHKQTPATLFVRLLENAAFRDQVAKHVKRHFHGDGALTPAHTVARWRRLKESIAAAIPSETARWGGWKRRQRLVHQQHWNAEQTWLLESYLPQRTQVVLEQLRNHGIYTGK